MDLYLFYNCFQNLYTVYDTKDEDLTYEHEGIFNNPLVLYNYHKYNNNQTGGALAALSAAAPLAKAALSNPEIILSVKYCFLLVHKHNLIFLS